MKVSIIKRLYPIILASYLALVFCLLAPGPLYAASSTQIFVMHSYSQEYAWTQGQHEGFIQALVEDARVDADVSTEYLDTKRHPYDEAYANEMARHLRIKYKGYRPAGIYVSDDNALLFARDHLSRIFPGVPVFFSGVNDYGVQGSLDPALFTGVFERKEVGPNIEWLLHLDKEANDLIFIGDGSNTYQAIENELRSELIQYRLRVTFIAEKELSRALNRLHDLPGKYIFLTTLGGMTDENGKVLPLRDIMKNLTSMGRIVISMEDAYIIEGVLGGYVTSGRKQGMSAARLLLAYQHGKPIVDLPPILKSPNALIFDDRVLQQHNITLPENLRSQALLLHSRLGFYEQYRSMILGMLIGFATLLFLVGTVSLVIVSRKNRELTIARSSAESVNALFNQLAEQSRTVHWEVNAEGLYTFVSPVSRTILGYQPEELVYKQHFSDLFPGKERDTDKTAALEFLAQKKPFHNLEMIGLTKDGRLIWLITNGIPFLDSCGTFLGYRGSFSDISERKEAEQALIESEKRLKLVTDHVPALIGYVDKNYKYQFVNKNYEKWFGLKRSEMLGRSVKALLPPGAYELSLPLINRALTGEEVTFEGTIKLPDGTTKVFFNHLVPDCSSSDETKGYYVLVSDITERKRAEEVLHEQKNKLLSIFRAAPVGIGMVINRVFREANDTLCKMTGYSREELLNRNAQMLYPTQEDYDYVGLEKYRQISEENIGTVETRWKRKDGTVIDIILSSTPLDSSDLAKGVTFTALDITERKRSEEQRRSLVERLQRSEKMEALGQLAGGVAHDLNNVLGVLTGYSELLLGEIPEGHRTRGHAEKILESAEKGAAIIQDLLTLARRGVTVSDVINLNSIVSDFLKTPVFEKIKDYHPRVIFRAECDKNFLNIKGSNVHLEKTLMNLVSNAAESISGEGEVVIRTESRYLDEVIRSYDEVKEGDYAVLSVSDTGVGIPAENIKNIFEPFYTKKKMGRSGTGLGLSIVWGTVKDHNGYIDVQTEVGKGTTFTLYFPVTREELIAQQQKMPIEQYMGNGESVLVVDDIAEQRDVAAGLLTRLGYHIHAVSSGEEAVEYLKVTRADILVLDMIMPPGMDGLETYQRVLEVNPKQKAIIVSGFSDTDRVKRAQKLGAGAYVKKPYVMEKIGMAIRKELERK